MHWHFACMYVYLCTTCMTVDHRGQKASDPLELELLMVMSHHVGARTENLGPLKELQCFFSEPSLQSTAIGLCMGHMRGDQLSQVHGARERRSVVTGHGTHERDQLLQGHGAWERCQFVTRTLCKLFTALNFRGVICHRLSYYLVFNHFTEWIYTATAILFSQN